MPINGYDPLANKHGCFSSNSSCNAEDMEDMFNVKINNIEHFQAMVADSDPQAAALGYKADATKVDKRKQPKYAAGQKCGTCALFQGKAVAASGFCALFPGKQVSTKGWCSAYNKKKN